MGVGNKDLNGLKRGTHVSRCLLPSSKFLLLRFSIRDARSGNKRSGKFVGKVRNWDGFRESTVFKGKKVNLKPMLICNCGEVQRREAIIRTIEGDLVPT